MARAGVPRAAPPRRRTPRRIERLAALAVAVAFVAAGCAGPVGVEPEVAGAPAGPLTQSPKAAATATPAPEPLVTATPDAHSQVGDLVRGFPVDLLPVPSDAVILVTSAVPVGDADVQEVSLNLRTSATPADLATMYRDALTAAGFIEVAPAEPQSTLAVESTFTRSGGDELISIGVLDEGGSRTVTIGGRVHTDG